MYVKFNFLAPDCKEKTYTEIPINLFILDVIWNSLIRMLNNEDFYIFRRHWLTFFSFTTTEHVHAAK
jgi:hypothetical protein